jgi:hypothetical protein
LEAELAAIDERENSRRVELSTREFADINAELANHRAGVVAERELRAEDEAALGGLEDWRRGRPRRIFGTRSSIASPSAWNRRRNG